MNESTLRKTGLLLLVFSMCLLTLSPPLQAEEGTDTKQPDTLPDKFMLRGGWAYVFGSRITAAVGGPVLGVGTSVDFTTTLGGSTSTDAFRVDTLYRFNDRHAIGFSWYRVGLSGEKNLNEQILIKDQTISAGTSTSTSLSFNIYRLLYDYSFYRNEKVELGISPGLYMMQTKFHFAGQGTINNVAGSTTIVNEELTLPLPSIGLVANYNITPKLGFQSRYDFFYLSIGNYTGTMFEFYAGLEYRLFKHFAMGAAYDRLQASLRGDGDRGFNADFSYNLAYVYGA